MSMFGLPVFIRAVIFALFSFTLPSPWFFFFFSMTIFIWKSICRRVRTVVCRGFGLLYSLAPLPSPPVLSFLSWSPACEDVVVWLCWWWWFHITIPPATSITVSCCLVFGESFLLSDVFHLVVLKKQKTKTFCNMTPSFLKCQFC